MAHGRLTRGRREGRTTGGLRFFRSPACSGEIRDQTLQNRARQTDEGEVRGSATDKSPIVTF